MACAIPTVAQAQDEPAVAQAQDEPEDDSNQIVVTGTLIRGVAPTGTQVVSVSAEDIVKTGVVSTNNLLATMPLLSTFNTVAKTPSDLGNQANRPNIRGLSIGQYSPSTTLILLDGHNMVGASILQTTPDPTMIAPGALQRVEVVPDGGSALYGSDAVSGIVNFITRKSFDGTEVSIHRGFADHYDTRDISLVQGVDWEGGSAVLSYFGRDNSNLLAKYRDLPADDHTPWGGNDGRSRNCASPNILLGGGYAMPGGAVTDATFDGLVEGTVNLCDNQQIGEPVVPEEFQHAISLGMQQEITPTIHFEMTGYWTQRKTSTPEVQQSSTVTIDDTNPFFHSIDGETSHRVGFSYSPAMGPFNVINPGGVSDYSKSYMSSYGVTPSLSFELSPSWDVTALLNYGWSEMILHDPKKNSVAEGKAVVQGDGPPLTVDTALNPYDIAQTSPDVLQGILNWDNHATTIQILKQARVIANGSLFSIGGGEVRAALGGQISEETYDAFNVDAPYGVDFGKHAKFEKRKVYALFGEVRVPLVGPDNAMPGIQALTFNLSGRYDKYENCCETTNPKLGVTWEPFDGLSLRGSWGTSFNAPSMADTGNAVDTRVGVSFGTSEGNLAPLSYDPLRTDATDAVDLLRPSMFVPGGSADLQPQDATTWSVGADIRPSSIPQLSLSLTYWNVALSNSIGTSTYNIQQEYVTPEWQKYFVFRPTLEEALAAFGGLEGVVVQGAESIESLYEGPPETWPYLMMDARRHNLGNQYVDGFDVGFVWNQPTDFGSIRATFDSSYIMHRTTEEFSGAPVVDLLLDNNRQLVMSGTLGAIVGDFTASATVNYSGGYNVLGIASQDRVKSFTPVNMFFRYSLEGLGMDLTLNVDNVFQTKPPFYDSRNGIANGATTLGRYFNFGVRKRW
jgi:iron complex outermembrane receptor protein